MSAETWKPGAVAFYDDVRVFLVSDASGLRWIDEEGDHRFISLDTVDRALVVVDPEDGAQLDRMVKAFKAAWVEADLRGEIGSRSRIGLLAALDAATLPPKPEEPSGWLAVVEDVDGVRWVAMLDLGRCEAAASQRWAPEQHLNRLSGWRAYADVAAVRVVSAGVSS